jgi:selenide,water dikinase
MFDLLDTVEYGGCSAKILADILSSILKDLQIKPDTNLLVGTETHDDAAVYKINNDLALIFTTDFFPPICSDPYTFGSIAACNALSDIYAMGGKVLITLNIIMFPSQKIPLEVLKEILQGGNDKVEEGGGIIVGGHTIDDDPPKYGLAVIGTCHLNEIITNNKAQPNDVLILTKSIGTGIITAGKRLKIVSEKDYNNSLKSMQTLNKQASEIMQKYKIKCATDITGFGLLGHALKMAIASNVKFIIEPDKIPVLKGTEELIETGCIPGACFKNQRFVESTNNQNIIIPDTTYNKKMLLFDAQTSGGMLICVPPDDVDNILYDLKVYYPETTIIGKVE